MVSVGLIRARSGPICVLRSKPKDWPYLGLDGPPRDSEGTFPSCQPPLLVVSIPQRWMGFLPAGCLFGRMLGCFGARAPTKNGPQTGPKSVETDFVQNVTLACRCVFSHFEACSGRFDRPYAPKSLNVVSPFVTKKG